MLITPKSTLQKNINELLSQVYELDDENDPVPDKYQTQRLSDTPQHTSLVFGIVLKVESQQDTAKRGLGCMDLVKKHSEDSITSQSFSSFSLNYTLRQY